VRKTAKNAHQKRAHRPGEVRVNAPELSVLLRYARSDETEQRKTAATYLCPCHLRKPSHEAAVALQRLMQDPDLKVRQAAWHTIEDGGPTAEAKEIADKIRATETDPFICNLIDEHLGSPLARQRVEDRVAVARAPQRRGKCDFCGKTGIMISERFDIDIPAGDGSRAAMICNACGGK
jgi:hypothetical protein